MHDEDEAATGLASELGGEAIDIGDSPGAIRGISKVLDPVGWLDEAEVEREGLSLIETVDTCHIPRMSETTGKDGTLARTSTHKARLIPHSTSSRPLMPATYHEWPKRRARTAPLPG